MRRVRLFLIASLVTMVACLQIGYCQDDGSITTSPQIKKYILKVPKKFKNDGEKLPLVVFLHGAGTLNKFDVLQDKVRPILNHQSAYPFIFFAPLFTDQDDWNANFASLKSMLDQVISQYPVDTSRIYLTGISMGGYAGTQFAIENPDLFAAFASLAGGPLQSSWSEDTLKSVGAIKNLPVRIYHGDKDTTVYLDCSQTLVRAINEAGGNAALVVLPGRNHDIIDLYNKDDVYAWLFQNQKGK